MHFHGLVSRNTDVRPMICEPILPYMGIQTDIKPSASINQFSGILKPIMHSPKPWAPHEGKDFKPFRWDVPS